jgi:hypothetical protein
MSRWRWGLIGGVAVAIAAAWWWRTTPAPRDVSELPVAAPAPYGQLEASPPLPLPEPEPEPVISGAEAAERLAGPNGIVCRLEPAVSGGAARLVPETPDPEWLAVALVGAGYLVLSEVPPTGAGTLRVEGFAPIDLRWDEALEGPLGLGDCAPSPVVLRPAEAAIVGTVAGARGRAALVSVEACGQSAPLQDDGSFYLAVADGETCEVVARRHLGVLDFASEAVEVTARAGHDSIVELAVPDVEAVVPVVLDRRVGRPRPAAGRAGRRHRRGAGAVRPRRLLHHERRSAR